MKGAEELKPEEIQIDQELIDKTGELIAILGLNRARSIIVEIFKANDWEEFEAVEIVDRTIKAWREQQGIGQAAKQNGGR